MLVKTPYDALNQLKFISMGVFGLQTLEKSNYRTPELETFLKMLSGIKKYNVPSSSSVKENVLNDSLEKIKNSIGKNNKNAIAECTKLSQNMDKIYLDFVLSSEGTCSCQS
jgi:hypothetical protein